MPNRFPGVDPYLESQGFWPDFHASFITYWRDALAEQLPENYEARIDERVNLVQLPPRTIQRIQRIAPDVVVSHRESATALAPPPAGVATMEPVTIPLVIDEEVERETYIEILHRPERSLVAVLELLSPSNKEEPGRAAYLMKHYALLRHSIHLVELDLLLGGQRLPLEKPYPPGDYFALISREDRRPDCQVYSWTVQQPLPSIPIPLKTPDPDIWIDLGEVFAITYDRGRYARSIDYTSPPPGLEKIAPGK
jgi:hypothetical protein